MATQNKMIGIFGWIVLFITFNVLFSTFMFAYNENARDYITTEDDVRYGELNETLETLNNITILTGQYNATTESIIDVKDSDGTDFWESILAGKNFAEQLGEITGVGIAGFYITTIAILTQSNDYLAKLLMLCLLLPIALLQLRALGILIAGKNRVG